MSNATGLVAEVQITLSSLLHVKASGGHTAYALSRRLKLLEPKTFRHQGALSSEMLKNLASGVLQVLRADHPPQPLTPQPPTSTDP